MAHTILLAALRIGANKKAGKGEYKSSTKTKDKPETHKEQIRDTQGSGKWHRSTGDLWMKAGLVGGQN